MADVNWTKYRCSICLMLGLIVSAVVTALIGWLLLGSGLPIVLTVILLLVVWAVLGLVADHLCHAPGAAVAAHAAPAGHDHGAHAAEEAARQQAAARAAAAAAEREAAEAARRAEAARAASAAAAAEHKDGADVPAGEGTRPAAMDGPRGGKADDLKKIKGIGPKLEQLCNELGFYHFDQIAAWTADEVAWVDSNLEGFRGRVSRDEWVAQARALAEGGETDHA